MTAFDRSDVATASGVQQYNVCLGFFPKNATCFAENCRDGQASSGYSTQTLLPEVVLLSCGYIRNK